MKRFFFGCAFKKNMSQKDKGLNASAQRGFPRNRNFFHISSNLVVFKSDCRSFGCFWNNSSKVIMVQYFSWFQLVSRDWWRPAKVTQSCWPRLQMISTQISELSTGGPSQVGHGQSAVAESTSILSFPHKKKATWERKYFFIFCTVYLGVFCGLLDWTFWPLKALLEPLGTQGRWFRAFTLEARWFSLSSCSIYNPYNYGGTCDKISWGSSQWVKLTRHLFKPKH